MRKATRFDLTETDASVPERHPEPIRPANPALTGYFPNLPAVDGCRDIAIAMSNILPRAMLGSASPQS
jgi:hypothetical protein